MADVVLKVDTGLQHVKVKDAKGNVIGEFDIIPTDSNMVKRYASVAEFFDKLSLPQNPTDEQLIKASDDVCDQFDYLLGDGVSEGLFGKCGPFTLLSNGDLFFENVLDGIAGMLSKASEERAKKKLNKIKMATAGYEA